MAELNIGDKAIRDFLLEYSLLKGRLIRLESERRRILNSGPKEISSVVLDGMPKGNNSRNTYGDMSRLIEIPAEINEIKLIISETDKMLEMVDVKRRDKAYSKILRGFYIDGKSITKLAIELECSEDNIYKLKQQAVKNFNVILLGKDACQSKCIKCIMEGHKK